MRECTVCGEQDFEEHDGLYFCSTCNTQSQEVRVMVAEEENFDNFRRTGVIRQADTTKRSKKRVNDDGRPWSVYEAYQLIIQHQVEALISLGAQEHLRDVVYQIWVNYLSKLGLAFSEEPVNPALMKYGRQRELFPSTTDNPRIKNVLGRRSRLTTQGMSAKQAKKQMEKDQVVEALQNEEFYQGDNPLNDSHGSEGGSKRDEWNSEEEGEKQERWGRYRKSLKSNAVEKVRMASTIAICFLGLMYTNPFITATDLIRWIQKKLIPYIDVKSIIPDDMKFCLNDWQMFGMGLAPTLEQLRQMAGTIAYFLDLRDFPEFPLDELVNKYIIQLDLPAEFHGYAMNLMKTMQIYLRYIPTHRHKHTIFWEGAAMAYIVIMLKLFFGINDSNEILLSAYTKELIEISQCSLPLFVWTDWVQHMKSKMQIADQNRNGRRNTTVNEQLGRQIDGTHYSCNVQLYHRSVREAIEKPFTKLSQRWKSKQTQSSAVSGSVHGDHLSDIPFNLDINTLDEVDPLEALQHVSREDDCNSWNSPAATQERDNVEINKKLRLNSDKFRKSTVQHIVSPETYLNDLNNRHELDHSQSSTQETRADFSVSEAIMNDYFEADGCSGMPIKKRKVKHVRKKKYFDEEESSMHNNIEQYQAVIEKLTDLKSGFKTSLDYETKDVCLSYGWLLKICSHMIESKTEDLKDEIRKFEIMFFADQADDSLSSASRHHRTKLRRNNQYFGYKIRKY